MTAVNMHQAKTHLSRLVERAAAGEEIVIARNGKPVAKLVPLNDLARPRVLDTMRGLIDVPDDFDAPMPAEWLAEFYGVDPEEIDVAVEVQDRLAATKASAGGVAPSPEAKV